MAIYPDDATAPVTAFGVVSDVTFSSTGPTRTDFNLGSTVDHRGEVVAFIDGVLQQTGAYDLSNSGQTVSFLTAPNASNLTLKTVSLPSRFKLTRTFPAVRTVDFSNTTATVLNSNTFLINSNTESFSLPEGVNVSTKAEFMVFMSGVFQNPDSYTYPSVVYGDHGIDIGDNTATKLLLNFDSNTTDESPSAHTVTANGGSAFTGHAFNFSGSNFLNIADSSDFDVHLDNFTHDAYLKFNTDSITSDQAIFGKVEDISNYYVLKYFGSNSNVGFLVNTAGTLTEVIGGNVNADSNYHVAVSYERNTQNLRLYVNNVLVDHTNYTAATSPSGPLELGNSNLLVNTLDAKVSFYRFAKSARYRADAISPIPDANYRPTVISGAPLGAIDSEDQLSLRVFDSEVLSADRFNSMADRKPDKGFNSQRTFDSIKFTSQAGYEKRRLRSRRSKRSYDLSYTNVTGIEKNAIENFYNARSGEFEAFTFDLSHINESGTITTRFDGPLSINHVASAGSNLTENFYTVTFKLQETYD